MKMPIAAHVLIIFLVQRFLRSSDLFLCFIGDLPADHFLHRISQIQKRFRLQYLLRCSIVFLHDRILTVIHLAVPNGIRIVSHARIRGNHVFMLLILCFVLPDLLRTIDAMNFGGRCLQLFFQVRTRKRIHGKLFRPIHGSFFGKRSKDHIRMLDKVAVDGNPIVCQTKTDPVRFINGFLVSLLEEQDISNDFGSGVCLESIVRQTDSSQQIGPLRDILPRFRIFRVHCIAACHKGKDPTGTHLVDGFREKVIVDAEIERVVFSVVDLVISERHVADGQVIEVSHLRGLKSCNGDIGLWIQVLCDPSGDAVKLHTIQAAPAHPFRQHSEKVSNAHCRFQDRPLIKSESAYGGIYRLDHRRAGVMRVQRGCSRGCVLFRSQQLFQLLILLFPLFFSFIKCVRDPAPADVMCEDFLLLRTCLLPLCFEFFQQPDRTYIVLEPCLCAAFLCQVDVMDSVVLRLFWCCRLLRGAVFRHKRSRPRMVGICFFWCVHCGHALRILRIGKNILERQLYTI